MKTFIISSNQNPKIKTLIALRKASQRKNLNTILIEGKREVSRALSNSWEVKELFICPEWYNTKDTKTLDIPASIKVYQLDKSLFKKISYRDTPDGYIATAQPKKQNLNFFKGKEKLLLLACEKIEKPGNVGAMLRTLDAINADGLIMINSQIDPWNPNVIRASTGVIFNIPVVSCSLEEWSHWSKQEEVHIIATSPAADLSFEKSSPPDKTALLIGSEAHGLSTEAFNLADTTISIPMLGTADSLNASVSAAVILFHWVYKQ